MTFKEKILKLKKLGYDIAESENFTVDTFINLDSIESEEDFKYFNYEKGKQEPINTPTGEKFGYIIYKGSEVIDFELSFESLLETIDEILEDSY